MKNKHCPHIAFCPLIDTLQPMKTLAVAFTFAFLASTSLHAQENPDVDGLGYARPQFNNFAVNGKFYHNIKLISVKDGVAELQSTEGRISALWSKLPVIFQHDNAGLTANNGGVAGSHYIGGVAASGSGYSGDDNGSTFNDFAVNGKFYHNIKLLGVKNGVAALSSVEGQVSTSWEQLPTEFQRRNTRAKTIQDANEARGREIANAKIAAPLTVFNGLTADSARSHLALIGTKETFDINGNPYKMQEGKPYTVVGITPSNSPLVATEYGTTVFSGSDWIFELEAGNSANAPAIFLKDAKATGAVHQSVPAKSDEYGGLRSLQGDGRPYYDVSYSCDLVSAENLEQVYAACLWLKDEKAVAIDFQTVGTLTAGKPDSLVLGHSVPLSHRDDDLTYQIHIFSGKLELREVDQVTELRRVGSEVSAPPGDGNVKGSTVKSSGERAVKTQEEWATIIGNNREFQSLVSRIGKPDRVVTKGAVSECFWYWKVETDTVNPDGTPAYPDDLIVRVAPFEGRSEIMVMINDKTGAAESFTWADKEVNAADKINILSPRTKDTSPKPHTDWIELIKKDARYDTLRSLIGEPDKTIFTKDRIFEQHWNSKVLTEYRDLSHPDELIVRSMEISVGGKSSLIILAIINDNNGKAETFSWTAKVAHEAETAK